MTDSAPLPPLTPDPKLERHFQSERERVEMTRDLFNRAAPDYDRAEWVTGFGTGPWYRRRVLREAGLKPGMTMLDVATGTGLVAREALKLLGPDGKLVGLDPSPGMMAEARKSLAIETVEAGAERMPLPDAAYDFLTLGYALRHIADLRAAFGEFHRVLKPGGTACILEIVKPRNPILLALLHCHLKLVVPALGKVLGYRPDTAKLWTYYSDTIDAAASAETVLAALRESGFARAETKLTLGMFREYLATKN